MKSNDMLLSVFCGVTMAILLGILFNSDANTRRELALIDAKVETTKVDLSTLELRVNQMEVNSREMLGILKRLDVGLEKLFEEK